MLYCPQCNQNYEEGVQRFCTNDGVRLLSAVGAGGQPKGIFTNVLNRTPADRERSRMFTELPKLVNPGENQPRAFQPQTAAAGIKQAVALDAAYESKPPTSEDSSFEPEAQISKPETGLPAATRLIKHNEVPVSHAPLGDRAARLSGRESLGWKNSEDLIGQTIKGRYTITDKLGEDETGIVYLAEDKIKDRKKVVARILTKKEAGDESSKILAEERVSLSHVNHPNIAYLLDSGELAEGFAFVITEYIAGESLKEKINSGEQFDVLRCARLIRQTANALSEAHRSGVLHRNLKPENIIIGVTESATERVKVTDFGVFDGFEEQSPENLAYLSPERLDEKPATAASDIYSLAVIAFQLLTGRLPFDYSTRRELAKAQKENLSLQPTDLRLDVPPSVNEVLGKALACNPAERYPQARDFGDAFYNALATERKEPTANDEVEDEIAVSAKSLRADSEMPPIPKSGAETSAVENIAFAAKSRTLPIPEKFPAAPTGVENKPTTAKNDLLVEKRSPVKMISGWRLGLIILGILILCASLLWGIWNYFFNRQEQPVYTAPQAVVVNQKASEQTAKNTDSANDLKV